MICTLVLELNGLDFGNGNSLCFIMGEYVPLPEGTEVVLNDGNGTLAYVRNTNRSTRERKTPFELFLTDRRPQIRISLELSDIAIETLNSNDGGESFLRNLQGAGWINSDDAFSIVNASV